MLLLTFVPEEEPANAIRHKVVEVKQMSFDQMMIEIYYLIDRLDVVEGDTVVLKFKIMGEFNIEQAYRYSGNFEREVADRCTRNLIPLYVPFALEYVTHDKMIKKGV